LLGKLQPPCITNKAWRSALCVQFVRMGSEKISNNHNGNCQQSRSEQNRVTSAADVTVSRA
jgi:hypothetical protein